MLTRDYFYLPPPKYEIYRDVSTPTSTRQIIGISRDRTGEVLYRVFCEEQREIIAIKESRILCSEQPISYHGFIWHLDLHFPNKWTYHVENILVESILQPLYLRNINTASWRDNSQKFINWISFSKTKVDATLTLRTNDGWLIDSWHLYDLKVIKSSETFGIFMVDLDYDHYKKSEIQWEDEINYELQHYDCSIVATISRTPYGKRVKKFLTSFDQARKTIMDMQERYSKNIGLFFLDALHQEERDRERRQAMSDQI